MIKSLVVVYCNIMFHVAEAKIIRHINKALHDETLAHFSVPKRKSAGEKKGALVSSQVYNNEWSKAIKPHIFRAVRL